MIATRSPLRAMPDRVTPPASPDSPAPTVGGVAHVPPATGRAPEPAATGDASPSERLWHDVHARLTAFVAQRVDDPADVADLVQTVLLRAHQHMASIADEQRLLPWLFQITRNAIADYYRAPARRREIGGIAPDGALELRGGPGAAATLASTGDTGLPHPAAALTAPDDESALRELAGCVRPLVQLLPSTYREALTLVEFDGVSQVEVASRLGISVSGMKSRVQRGRAMLREGLLACCDVSRSATGGVLDFAPRAGGSCADAESGGAAGSGAAASAPCGGVVPLRRGPAARRGPAGPVGD